MADPTSTQEIRTALFDLTSCLLAACAERDALQARIDGAPNVRLHGATTRIGITGYFVEEWPVEMVGQRVALVALDAPQ